LAINASILILAASTFNQAGETAVDEIDKAYLLLQPLLGSAIAPVLFGIALLCSGLNSTVTATLAGQIVMEGFIRIRLKPWLRRLLTRILAIGPALFIILYMGSSGAGRLLILSQVVLSFQLPFAVVPLVWLTASRAKMGELVAPRWVTVFAAATAIVIIGLNINLIGSILFG
jgi:manganese transport protein